jgi:hypothetical protein
MTSKLCITVPALVLSALILAGCSSPGTGNSPVTLPDTVSGGGAGNSASQAPAPPPSDSQGTATRPSSLAGVWSASDGTSPKIISDDGQCSGMYYDGSSPLDIGGPMSCTFAQNQSDGYYLLVVRQSPNQASYEVRFSDDNTMTMYTTAGAKIVTLTRQ